MDNEKRIKILERSFSIMEEIILNCFNEDEKELRQRMKSEGDARLDECRVKRLGPDEYCAIKDALTKLSSLSYNEIEEMYHLLKD